MKNYREGLSNERKWRFQDRAKILKRLGNKSMKSFNQALKVYEAHTIEIHKINKILNDSPLDEAWIK